MLIVKKMRPVLATVLLTAAFAPSAFADHVFLQVPGIPGESVADGYKDWIDATAFGQDFNRRSCGGITLAKGLDKASALLAVAAVTGDVQAQATIAVRGGGAHPIEYLRLVLADVIVSSINIQTSDPTRVVTESLRLIPRSVTITYRQQQLDGSLGSAMTTVITCNRPRD